MFSKSPRCQVLPLPGNQWAFGIDQRERLRWHASNDAPRPFFYPLIGPHGLPLTRMGHPGAPNHDHHRSIWFAHHQVLGIDFWSEETPAVIRQQQWLACQDGDDEARLAVELRWYDGHDPQPLLHQQLITAVSPAPQDGVLVEIQTSLIPTAESLELGQTNFGLLAVRVAKSISAIFGDGVLTSSSGQQGEAKLFGMPAAWIDYSGSIDTEVSEGITYFDHPHNHGYPNKWHVRDDGWMGASINRDGPLLLHKSHPTTWRYLLHAHRGHVDRDAAEKIALSFGDRAALVVRPSPRPHHHATIERAS
jgi:hypothetical protein